MLDLGGAPSSLNDSSKTRHLNLNKNCHLQVVLFDFDLLCRSVHSADDKSKEVFDSLVTPTTTSQSIGSSVQPDISKIQQVASLLRVDLTGKKDEERSFEEDDLSLLTGEPHQSTRQPPSSKQPPAPHDPNSADIRHKYAAKLQKRTGASHVTSPASSNSAAGAEGDAAFHLAARQAVVASGSPADKTRWMAATGTGQLLQYLHSRSLQLVLHPATGAAKNGQQHQRSEMQDFVSQMKDKVSFSHILYPGVNAAETTSTSDTTRTPAADWTADRLMDWASQEYATMIDRCLWVSDRDDVLRAARALGCITLRVRPPNARRGNVSSHYTVESVPDTVQIVNEINGISFNTVLSSQQRKQW